MIFGKEEELIAKCFIEKEGDENNVCYLTSTSLHIKQNKKVHSFFNYWIKQISFKHKKFLIPIVIGGIAAPLAALGLYQYYLNPWVMLSILFLAIFTIYYGIEGGMALCIETPIKEYDFFIKKTTPNLESFIAFVKSSLLGNQVGFYFTLSLEQWQKSQEGGYIAPANNGITLFNNKAAVIKNSEIILEIIMPQVSFEIKYEMNENGSLIPKVFDKIPLTQIKKIS